LNLGYVAVAEGRVSGYILAEARAWEFGSPLCGWIFAIGVDPKFGRRGIGLALCREVCSTFKSLDIRTVRTMVRKDDVEVLSFFRASGFRGGPFIELELEL
jgi:ribosomal protein S18 acetylase RimI-like enzyme